MQTLTLDWADGSYSFRLRHGEWIELQQKLDMGPLEMLQAFLTRKWRVGQSREVIRLGLIGGGTKPADALALVRRYVEDRPPPESVGLAVAILEAGLFVPKDEAKQAGEPQAGETPQDGASIPPPSTETRQ